MGLAPDTWTFDCADPVAVATFWAAALDFELADADPEGSYVADPSGRTRGLFFQPVPEAKTVKNRVHLDVRPSGSMTTEVQRLQGIGATVHRRVDKDGSFWTIMADVEGNEFCVLRGPDDGWTADEL